MDKKYRRMLKIMEKNEKKSGPTSSETWFVYVLECSDSSFYTGITNNIERRIRMHQDGKASRFTRTRRPVRLLYQESCNSRTQALVRECALKALPRRKKEVLVGFTS